MKNNKYMSFPRNVVGNLPLSTSLTKEEKQPYLMKQVEDPRTLRAAKHSGMTGLFYHGNNNAFTLIELLVVVLIIGILAAVALPQYQKAVEKSRGVQALTLINAVNQAVQVYFMANGTFPQSFDELNADMDSWTGNEQWCNLANSSYGVIDTRSNGDWSLQLYKTRTNNLYLFVGRLSGKYAGAGFSKQITSNAGNNLVSDTIYCAERTSNGKTFTATANSYCQGIWKAGNDTGTAESYRRYPMP